MARTRQTQTTTGCAAAAIGPERPRRETGAQVRPDERFVRARRHAQSDRRLPSTRGARALGLDAAAWPARAGVDYLVLAQEPDATRRPRAELAALAARPDVTVLRLATTGLSRSRNAALEGGAGGDLFSPTTT